MLLWRLFVSLTKLIEIREKRVNLSGGINFMRMLIHISCFSHLMLLIHLPHKFVQCIKKGRSYLENNLTPSQVDFLLAFNYVLTPFVEKRSIRAGRKSSMEHSLGSIKRSWGEENTQVFYGWFLVGFYNLFQISNRLVLFLMWSSGFGFWRHLCLWVGLGNIFMIYEWLIFG